MNELILIRHGEADHMVGELTGGWTDTRLTERGRRQAERTGERLARMLKSRPFQFYASTLLRAAETAEIIAKSLPVQPLYVDGLRELNNGVAAGRTKAEARDLELPQTHPPYDWVPYPGAESWRGMVERVWTFLDEIAEDPYETVLLVGHGNAGVAVVHWWLGRDEKGWTRISFDFEPCSITHLTVNRWGERTITRLNDNAHLEALDGAAP